MNTLTKSFFALAVTAFLGSCSRPVATFQRSNVERFYTAQAPTAPVAATSDVVAESVATTSVVATNADAKAQIEQALVKTEAYASTNARPAEARKLERRISKIRQVLATTTQQTLTSTKSAAKPTMVQKLMLKGMDRKIQKHLAPEQPQRSSNLTIGLVVGAIGLLLLLLSVANPLGLILLVVGIVLIILGLL